MTLADTPVPLEVRDLRGRSYRVGERPQDLIGCSRAWMLAFAWVAMAGIGVLQYGYGVALTALHVTSGKSLAGALWVLALWVVFQAGAAAPTAVLSQRFALTPARAVPIGAALCAAGPLTLGHTDNLLLAVLGYSALSGIGAGIVYATCTATVAKWYPEKRASRVGFVSGAIGWGAVPFVAAFAVVLTPDSRTGIFTAVGVIILVVVAQCGALLQDPPAGWWPSEIDPRQWAMDKNLNRGLRNNVTALRPYSPREAIRTPAFLVMYLILVVAAAASLLAAVYIPIVAISHGFSLAVAALAVGLLAVVNGAGRSMAGRLSDLFGRRQILTATLLVEGCAQLGLVYSASIAEPAAFVVFAALCGLAGGAFYPLVASLVADYFGEPSASRNFGLVYSAKMFGGIIGVGLPALLVTSQHLMIPFLVAGLLSLGAAVMTRMLHRPGLPTVCLPR
ncbi:MAG: OFA family MFS transporter [Mycobacterium sp.]